MKVMTIDLEEWFQVFNYYYAIAYNDWEKTESRIESSTDRLLDLLDQYNAKATFFVLGWIAREHPKLIKKISDRGHEIACHGFAHKPITLMTVDEFEEDIDKAVNYIKKACGV
ncbi:polysaccharide deacetylase family protein, partial [Candidatus Woesearchaeota archaeon]|nr:polysaccharide deacetylase family protein [Candidatus Woesearchaeota archaeon]